jgi:DNA topoisomerase-1
MSTLVIVESPSKIKSVGKYLGPGYVVSASVGHIRDLPKNSKTAIDIEAGFVPSYEISPGKERVIRELASLARKSKHILLATDQDREGEAIAWHVAEELRSSLRGALPPIQRITFNEITADAIAEAIRHPRDIDQNLRQAQEARRVLDRLMGYDLSGLIWKKVRYGLSAGRVQSPALRIIMEREREIRAFIPEWYGLITAHTRHTTFEIPLSCTTEFKDKTLWHTITTKAETHTWKIDAIEVSTQQRQARAPFTTSSLQQTASSRLGFSPKRTMMAAQKLYEQGHITYMRTDSTNLSKSAQTQMIAWVEKNVGKQYAKWNVYASKSKNAQEAHEAIRPTDPNKKSAGTTHDEQTLYELIWKRAVSSQMIAATVERTSIESYITHDSVQYTFSMTGQKILEPGWMRVDTNARSEDVELPNVLVGDILKLQSIEPIEKYTTPPNRYSEAGLIKELEKRGIGRPSTFASTIETLVDREYVSREGRTLKPTDTGDVVSSFLEEHFAEYIGDTFTAQMEEELDDIANGDKEYANVLSHWYWPLHNEVAKKDSELGKATSLGEADSKYTCPTCGSGMEIKLGRGGKFLSCNRYPDCNGALAIDGTAIREDEPIGIDPESNLPVYVLSGRFGPYVQLGSVIEKDVVTVLKNGKEKIKKEKINPKRASIPKGVKPEDVTLQLALHYLILPRTLGTHPDTGNDVITNTGQFGPYVGEGRNFRSLKGADDPYTITIERALELLNTPKALPKGVTEARELGINPKTKKPVIVYADKKGIFKKFGLRRIYIDTTKPISELVLEDAIGTQAEVAKKKVMQRKSKK